MEQKPAPTKGNLMATKKSLSLARMGYELMDRKHSILVREMMTLIDQAHALRAQIDETFLSAYAALQQANVTLGVVEPLAQSVPVEENLEIGWRSVMGVELPKVSLDTEPGLCYDLGSSNSYFDEAYLSFHRVKLLSARLAEIENSVFRLSGAIKQTQSRANALRNIIIPGLESDERSISDALEEKEREEFSRLKVIKRQKQTPTPHCGEGER